MERLQPQRKQLWLVCCCERSILAPFVSLEGSWSSCLFLLDRRTYRGVDIIIVCRRARPPKLTHAGNHTHHTEIYGSQKCQMKRCVPKPERQRSRRERLLLAAMLGSSVARLLLHAILKHGIAIHSSIWWELFFLAVSTAGHFVYGVGISTKSIFRPQTGHKGRQASPQRKMRPWRMSRPIPRPPYRRAVDRQR